MVEGVKPIDAKVPSPSKENKMASRETQPIDYDEAALAVYLPVAQFKKGSPY